LDASSVVFN